MVRLIYRGVTEPDKRHLPVGSFIKVTRRLLNIGRGRVRATVRAGVRVECRLRRMIKLNLLAFYLSPRIHLSPRN